MKKIPLEATLAGSYRFLFKNIVSIIGTMWFPYLLMFGLMAGSAYLLLTPEVLHGNFSHIDRDFLFSPAANALRGVAGLLGLVIAPMIMVNLMRHSLGIKTSTTFFYFSLGMPVWRLIAAVILAALLLICIMLLFVGIGVGGGFAAIHYLPKAAGVATTVVLGVVLFCAYIYACVRLCFFLPAVVVAEERVSLGRSWELGGGNFWRIIVIWLLVTIPVWVVAGIVMQVTVMPILFSEIMKLAHHNNPNDVEPLFRALLHALPVVVPVLILAGIAIRGLIAGAIGTAYTAVTAKPKEEEPAV